MAHDVAESGDRPADETAITSEMVRAGVLEFLSFSSNYEIEDDVVIRIFTAMLAARESLR